MSARSVYSVGSVKSALSGLSDECDKRGRKRRVNDDVTNDECEHEELTRVKCVSDKLRRFVLAESNRISKAACESILGLMSEYEECVMRVIMKNERLEGRLQERQLQERENVKRVNVSECYADVAKRNVGVRDNRVVPDSVNARDMSARENVNVRESARTNVRVRKAPPRKAYAVVVKPVNESADVTSEEIKKKVLNECNRTPASIKCASNHLSINYPLIGKLDTVKCCNCKGNHPAKTHFTTKSCIKIPYHTVYNTKNPSGKGHGGSAKIIKNEVKHHLSSKFSQEYIQATTITVQTQPRHKMGLQKWQEYFETLGDKYIAAGDYNAKHPTWDSRTITPRGRILEIYAKGNNLNIRLWDLVNYFCVY
ncbi:RNA-directed DNA polymerase from mobile element jockey [Habropoda laboriosa]|uniref:RNA-directed DNA polymerase from mobile element jockey n=1 Tax=Habropoda laboriosa TaxID=597456 RepID=A0A0L7QNC8_9HYME|nr:RNA-directed DNA polymerase from mobile element jockey [Habropoda laboriosa]